MNTRLVQFLAAEGISQAQFADTINVARASISHILAGRNKPSFDFIQSMGKNYPDLNLEWLITGKGKMYKNSSQSVQSPTTYSPAPENNVFENTLFNDEMTSLEDLDKEVQTPNNEPIKPIRKVQDKSMRKESAPSPLQPKSGMKKITKIVVFFDDNTFQELGAI